jgi:hypothetical protein
MPVTRALTEHRLRVIGVDFSAVQLARARHLVPAARLAQADMTAPHLPELADNSTTRPYLAPLHPGRHLRTQLDRLLAS